MMEEKDKCLKCKGEKILEENKEFDVKLEPGAPENFEYKFPGEGNEVVYYFYLKYNNQPEADAGDVVFVVKQKQHNKFKRRGADLIVEQEITLQEALTGGKFTIDFLGGKKHNLVFEKDKIVKPNDVLFIDGLGMPNHKITGYGKLYIIITIKFPSVLEETLHEKLVEVYQNFCLIHRALTL